MTPCEKLGYKVGDRFEIIKGNNSGCSWRTVGKIISLKKDDGSNNPFFYFGEGEEWYVELDNICPLKTEAEKRGAKFGTMGVVKATGERVVFSVENKDGGTWEVLAEGKFLPYIVDPSEIRLDHEPGYKEIPFSEATDDQRMDVRNIFGCSEGNPIEALKTVEGFYIYTFRGGIYPVIVNSNGVSNYTISVRVPA